MSDETPLRLSDLADVDAPDVVRAAVRRFRRRFFLSGLWIIGGIVVLAFVLPTLQPYRSLASRMQNAPGDAVGVVIDRGFFRVTVIDVRRVDEKTVVLHALVTSQALRPHENIRIGPDVFGVGNVATAESNGGKRFSEERGAGAVDEVWLAMLPGHPRFDVGFISGGGDAPGGNLTTIAGAQPKPDPALLAKRPAVITGTIAFDLRDLGVSESVWR